MRGAFIVIFIHESTDFPEPVAIVPARTPSNGPDFG